MYAVWSEDLKKKATTVYSREPDETDLRTNEQTKAAKFELTSNHEIERAKRDL